MSAAALDSLRPGDILEIAYRVWRPKDGAGEDVVDKWIGALVLECQPGAWPLVRLSDGQVTEVRPFMSWRRLHAARGPTGAHPLARARAAETPARHEARAVAR